MSTYRYFLQILNTEGLHLKTAPSASSYSRKSSIYNTSFIKNGIQPTKEKVRAIKEEVCLDQDLLAH